MSETKNPVTAPLDLARLEELRAVAIPGDLVYDESQQYQSNQRVESADICATDIPDRPVATLHVTAWKPGGKRDARPNARFLVALWNAWPAILQELRSSRAAVEAARGEALAYAKRRVLETVREHPFFDPLGHHVEQYEVAQLAWAKAIEAQLGALFDLIPGEMGLDAASAIRVLGAKPGGAS